jgi:hypothetical protein
MCVSAAKPKTPPRVQRRIDRRPPAA